MDKYIKFSFIHEPVHAANIQVSSVTVPSELYLYLPFFT